MKCKYCGKQTVYAEVCNSCSAVEYHLRKHAEPQGKLRIEHDNTWAVTEVNKQYEGILVDG